HTARSIGDPFGETLALTFLGRAQRLLGDHAAASVSLEEAVAVSHAIGYKLGEAEARNNLALLMLDTSRCDAALTQAQGALELARELAIPLVEARALEGIGLSMLSTGAIDRGIARLHQALAIYERLGVPEAAAVIAKLTGLEGPDTPSER